MDNLRPIKSVMPTRTPPRRYNDRRRMIPQPERLVLEPAERRDAVCGMIRSAERELALSVFRCDDFAVLDELAAAARRNVRIRALLTHQAKNWGRRLDDLGAVLQSMGAEVRRYNGAHTKYHAKYLIADSSRALVGSLNFTRKCFEKTCDFLLITVHSDTVRSLSHLFEADLDGAVKFEKPSDIGETLILGPELARSRLLEILRAARKSIRLIDHRVTDPAIVSTLRARQAEGVTVQILGRGQIPGLLSHGKMLLVDGVFASIGSLSLSGPSLDFRRELAVVVQDSANIARLDRFFDEAASAQVAASGVSLEWSLSQTDAADATDEEE